MRQRPKVEEHIRPTLRYLDEEGIAWQIEHRSKHSCLTATINGRNVAWYFSRTSSDRRSGMNFKSQVRRSVERHRQLKPGEAP